MTDLARYIRRRRLRLGLTQQEAAERAGVSLATWQNLERVASDSDGFQELTLARAAHGLGVDLHVVFDAAGRALPEHDPLATAPSPESTGDDPPGEADPEELLVHLGTVLRELADRSRASFMLVYGQALENAQHLLHVLDQERSRT